MTTAEKYYPEKLFSLGITEYKKYLETEEFIEFVDKLFGTTTTLGIPVLNGNNTFTGQNTFIGNTSITGDLTVDNKLLVTDNNTTIERTSAGNLQVNAKNELLLSSQESVRVKIETPVSNTSYPDSGSITLEIANSAATGDGGDVTITAGKAGNVTGSQTAGTAGSVVLITGEGADSENNPSSAGGEFNITTGDGGTASNSRGGAGGVLNLITGNGGNGTTDGGAGGNIQIVLGDGGTGTNNGNGGSLIIQPGEKGGGTARDGQVLVRTADGSHGTAVNPIYDGFGIFTKNILKCKYDQALDGNTVGSHSLTREGVKLPVNSYITRAWYVITEGFASAGGSATVAIGVDTDDATGIETATSVLFLGLGFYNGDPVETTATVTNITTDDRDIIVTIGTEDLTDGKMTIFLEYITL